MSHHVGPYGLIFYNTWDTFVNAMYLTTLVVDKFVMVMARHKNVLGKLLYINKSLDKEVALNGRWQGRFLRISKVRDTTCDSPRTDMEECNKCTLGAPRARNASLHMWSPEAYVRAPVRVQERRLSAKRLLKHKVLRGSRGSIDQEFFSFRTLWNSMSMNECAR